MIHSQNDGPSFCFREHDPRPSLGNYPKQRAALIRSLCFHPNHASQHASLMRQRIHETPSDRWKRLRKACADRRRLLRVEDRQLRRRQILGAVRRNVPREEFQKWFQRCVASVIA